MEKKYDVLEFYKIINELINLSKLEGTKEKFIDIDIIKDKSVLDKELMLMTEMIDFYKSGAIYKEGYSKSNSFRNSIGEEVSYYETGRRSLRNHNCPYQLVRYTVSD